MPKVGRYLIYGLIDPRDRYLKYIGKTHKRKEWRLMEHIKYARDNNARAVYNWIRELLEVGLEPEIFVWKKISANDSWRLAEKEAILFWTKHDSVIFPYSHAPQTNKSPTTIIKGAMLLNATNGG